MMRIARIAVWLLCWLGISAGDAAAQWNLLLVTADDMNGDSSGWMGSRLAATPNLDAFAATAHRFVNNHVSAPICQPSRSALMTGRVPHRSGALGFHPIRVGTPTLVSRLHSAGWFTAVIDKHPHMQPASEFVWDLKQSGSGKNPQQFGKHAAECIAAATAAGKPFFLNANITDPHRPFAGSQQGRNPKRNAKKATADESNIDPVADDEVVVPSFLEDIPDVRHEVAEYFTSIRRFDKSFGELMKVLRETGHDDDTLVIFMSDHGMSFPFSKATVYRNGTWSPLLVRWPNMGAPQTRQEFVSSVDILPAVLELLGQPPLDGIDGRSWLPLLKGQSQPDRDYVITHVNTVSSGKSFAQRCIRTRDFSYQFHPWADGTTRFRVEAMNGLSYNAMAAAAESDPRLRSRVDQLIIGVPQQFFDLRSDPDERVNKLDDPQYAKELDRLRGLLLAHMERTGDPQLEAYRAALGQATKP